MSVIRPIDAHFRDAIRSKAEGKGKDVDSLALSLIAAGANVNIPSTNSHGNPVTALNVFTNRGVTDSLHDKGARSVKDALVLRAAIDARDTNEALRIIRTQRPLVSFRHKRDISILSLAIQKHMSKLVIPLLDAGAEIEDTPAPVVHDGNTLLYAAMCDVPNPILEEIIRRGASIPNALRAAVRHIILDDNSPTHYAAPMYIQKIVLSAWTPTDTIARADILFKIGVELRNAFVQRIATLLGSSLTDRINDPIPPPSGSSPSGSSPSGSSPSSPSTDDPTGPAVDGGSRKRRSTRRRKPRKSKRAYTR